MKIHGGRYLNESDLRDVGVSRVGENVLVHEHTNLVGLENIEIGSNVRIDPYVIIVAAQNAKVTIGNFIHIAPNCSLVGAYGIEMHDMSTISHGVRIFTVSDDYSGQAMTNPMIPDQYKNTAKGKVVIGRHAVVGAGSIILPDIVLAEGAAVGALSLVNRSTDPWGIYAGIPARRLRDREKKVIDLEGQFLATISEEPGGQIES